MQATSFHGPPAPDAAGPTHPTSSVATEGAPRVLLGALALGVGTQALFFRTGLGLDWLAWVLGMIAVTFGVLRRGARAGYPIGTPAIGAALLAALLAAAFVAHRSDFTTAIALPASLVVLAALPILVAERLSWHDLARLPGRAFARMGRLPWAIFATVLLPRDAIVTLDGAERGAVRRTLAGLALGLPISGLFVVLLSGDAGFASVVGRVEARLDTAFVFGAQACATAVAFALGHGVYATTREAWGERGAPTPIDAPYRATSAAPEDARLAPLTWGLVLAQVAAVFGLYAFVHRDTEFGGHEVVRGRALVTYSNNLHAGFYQLLLATLLSVGLVLVGHRFLSRRDEPTVPGGAPLMALEGAVLLLTGVALTSCAHRLALYEEAYGATLLRLGVAFVVLAAAVLLSCTLIKSLMRGSRLFMPLALTGLSIVTLAAAWFDADAYVARTNLRRAIVDVGYLSTLSADACAAADLAQPAARAVLVSAWSQHGTGGDLRARRGWTRCPTTAATTASSTATSTAGP